MLPISHGWTVKVSYIFLGTKKKGKPIDASYIITTLTQLFVIFNKHWLNPADWEWCPEHKNTPRHFECTKTIKPEQVIVSIDKILNIY